MSFFKVSMDNNNMQILSIQKEGSALYRNALSTAPAPHIQMTSHPDDLGYVEPVVHHQYEYIDNIGADTRTNGEPLIRMCRKAKHLSLSLNPMLIILFIIM